MRFGYARVSTEDQKLDRQVDALEKAGCERIFLEKASGANAGRPELEKLLSALRGGDEVVVVKLDRISRSTRHLIELTEKFEKVGADFISLNDSIDTTTPMGRFFFRMMASIAELERGMIVERTKDGLPAARARGRSGGRPKADADAISKAKRMHESGKFSVSEITEATGISKSTLYRSLAHRTDEPLSGGREAVQCGSANRRKNGKS
ncbi:resolvase [Paraeggerthella hongkongensis]|uniref:recombinase family protein n=1 Tax=Paraeggerthella sp. TaxID=2897350 RepID=UPI000DF79E1A|nr:resolvase [Paraeggerthella hongkongensis]